MTTTLHVHHAFSYISFPFLHEYHVKKKKKKVKGMFIVEGALS